MAPKETTVRIRTTTEFYPLYEYGSPTFLFSKFLTPAFSHVINLSHKGQAEGIGDTSLLKFCIFAKLQIYFKM